MMKTNLTTEDIRDMGGLSFDDMTDPPPPDAINPVICPRCLGWGIIAVYHGGIYDIEQTADDCPVCDCEGWIEADSLGDG